ncbi:MAG: GNAT family N-acetyltransferase [Saccharofermentans sp.]|nr:GNAT family N-acetyltransferase [Saccharofermentans sp.]
MIREAKPNDLQGLLNLYLYLHEDSVPPMDEHLASVWDEIMTDPNHHIIVCEMDGTIVSSCVCVIIPNLTRGVRPYAFVENVVTHKDYRGRGLATQCLDYAKALAKEENCYKMMLLTGSKEKATLDFYSRAGYNSSDKTAFITWL